MLESQHHRSEWFMIVNPIAQNGRCLLEYPNISKRLYEEGVMCEPHFTERKFHAVELTVCAINEGYRKIIVVGGDGTLHEVVNGLYIQQQTSPSDVLIAVIAVGDNNEWLRNLGFKENSTLGENIKAIKAEESRLQDVGVVSYEEAHYRQSRYMVGMGSMGFSSHITKRHHHIKMKYNNSRWRYLLCVAWGFFRYKSKGVKVFVDDELVYNDLLFSAAIGIHKFNNAGVQPLPDAVADDGLLDVTLIQPMHFWHILFRLRYLFDGNLYRIGHTRRLRGKLIRIESIPDSHVEVDGELLGGTPLEFSVINRALRIVVKRGDND